MFSESLMKKIGLFAGGVLFGTAGVKILSSRDAKKSIYRVYGGRAAGKGLRDEKQSRPYRRMRRISLRKHSRSMKKGLHRKQRQCRRQRKTVRILQTKELCNRP